MKKFALIIPVFQIDSILRLFLESLVKTLTHYCQIFFINDGSGSQTRLILEEFQKCYNDKADICIIENKESQGCSDAINQALQKLTPCDYVVFMDSDLILQGQWQDYIIKDFEDESLGIVGGDAFISSDGRSTMLWDYFPRHDWSPFVFKRAAVCLRLYE